MSLTGVGIPQKSIRFADWELDASAFELRRGSQTVKLERIPVQVLLILIERHGKVVTREAIADHIWGKSVFVDVDNGINTAIRKIRQVLNDDPQNPRFVETIAGAGYRFIAPVETTETPELVVEPPRDVLPLVGTESAAPRTTEETRTRNVSIRTTVVSLALLLFAGISVGLGWRHLAARQPTIRSIAVLPLQNLSGDPEQEYFADGMTEELTTELAQISALKVISHTSAVQYKETKKSLPQIAKELGVDAVVEGAVERSGEKVSITVRLIQAPSDRHLWAQSYERDLRNVVELQREVTRTIVNGIEAKLTGPEKDHLANAPSVESQPYDSYLRGRFSLEEGDLNKSVAYFQQAIQEKPDYALAYAGLANAYISMGQPWFSDLSPSEVLPQARTAATRSLELDSSIGDTHLAMARVVQLYYWDWAVVEKEYRRALQLNQNNASAHAWFGEYLQEMGRNEEARAEYVHATELDPLNAEQWAGIGDVLYTSRQYDDAIPVFRKVLALDSENVSAHTGLGWVYEKKRMFPEAIAELEKAVDLGKRHEVTLASLGQVLAESGRQRDAENVLSELKRRSQRRYVSPCLFALVQAGLGERDQAIASLERGYTNRDQWMLYLKVDPHMDELRSDPRFRDLVRRVGFPQ